MVITKEIIVETRGDDDILDITDKIAELITDSRLKSGIVTAFITGSTAGVTTIEFEPGLVNDFQQLWENLAPNNVPYDHNTRWGDGNGYAHVRASLLGASLTVPFTGGKLVLGTWQQIVLVDFDNRPRQRTVIVQMMGE
jgi:secondary thiamine-phosphate synthase enzyme